MILVFLEVNGRIRFKECEDEAAARGQADAWLAEAKKSFPHPQKEFVPLYYAAKRIPV